MRIESSATRHVASFAIAAAITALSFAAHAEPPRARACGGVDYSAMILEIIRSLPTGGGYSLNADRVQLPTVTAQNIGGGHWEMKVYDGHPSHCTSAAYAVYARLAAVLHNGGKISLSADQIHSLEVIKRMPDGTSLVDGQGAYGIFNANGAGVAAFLQHTGTGMSFRDDKLAYARPGDFLKLFWNENVGASESGHQTIYTGRRVTAGRDMICFWGSQRQNRKKRAGGTEALYFPAEAGREVQDGYGEVCRPRSDVKAMVFSRVTCMEHLASGLDDMAAKSEAVGGAPDVFVDDYLYSLRKTSSNQATLDRMYDISASPDSLADVTPAPPQ
jgi:hypothetical protein